MKRWLSALLLLSPVLMAASSGAGGPAEARPVYDEYFLDRALRIDLYQIGDASNESVTVHRIFEEGAWPESMSGLIPPFDYGRYVCRLYDVASNRLIFARGFDSVFAEYKTTSPALAGTSRVFERSVRVPLPRRPVLFVVERRDKRQILHPILSRVIDPADVRIIREQPASGDWICEAQIAGDPRDKVDFAFIAEGYTSGDKDKFQADLGRMTDYLFTVEPYRSLRDRFNIRGVFRPSPERGMDEPRQRVFKKTVLNASFNAFDLDRYMLVEDDHRLHEIAGQVPYDTIAVLVNSRRYGGGSIGLDYCVTTVDHPSSLKVFVHELGHSFAYLADEYYQSEVSYNDFYPPGVEPLEPNITALLDPADVKWKDLLSPGIGVPTEYGKERIEALRAGRREAGRARETEVGEARKRGASAGEIKRIEDKFRKAAAALDAQIDSVRREFAPVYDKVGVFEGAGYASKGLFRPQVHCLMIDSPRDEFCAVCRRAIARMIEFYSR